MTPPLFLVPMECGNPQQETYGFYGFVDSISMVPKREIPYIHHGPSLRDFWCFPFKTGLLGLWDVVTCGWWLWHWIDTTLGGQ